MQWRLHADVQIDRWLASAHVQRCDNHAVSLQTNVAWQLQNRVSEHQEFPQQTRMHARIPRCAPTPRAKRRCPSFWPLQHHLHDHGSTVRQRWLRGWKPVRKPQIGHQHDKLIAPAQMPKEWEFGVLSAAPSSSKRLCEMAHEWGRRMFFSAKHDSFTYLRQMKQALRGIQTTNWYPAPS